CRPAHGAPCSGSPAPLPHLRGPPGLPYHPAAHRPKRMGAEEGSMPVYAQLGVRTVINARGNATLAGGTLMDQAVLEAMAEAARSFVRIADLEVAASQRI